MHLATQDAHLLNFIQFTEANKQRIILEAEAEAEAKAMKGKIHLTSFD
jgi:hypothetical protein